MTLAKLEMVLAKWRPIAQAGSVVMAHCEGQFQPEASFLSEATGPPERAEAPPVESEALEAILGIQPGEGKAALQGVISLFLESASVLVGEIGRAAEVRDSETMHRAAHTLRSSSAILGALQLAGIARKVEEMGLGRAGEDTPAVLVAKLEAEYDRVRADLEQRLKRLLEESPDP